MPLHFVTSSKGKFAEVRALYPDVVQLDIDLPEIQEFDAVKIVEAKLAHARRHCQGELIVEDTSLYLDCLGGLPGPFTKWFLQRLGERGLFEVTATLGNDRARARTIVGYADGQARFFEGEVDGRVVAPRGAGGFGWDRLFQPAGSRKTFAEMDPAEKNAFSMRRVALERFLAYYRGTRSP